MSEPARVSTSWMETSGLIPGVTLRKTLSRESSPNITEELDCSPLNSVEWASRSSSCPGSRWNTSSPSVVGPRSVTGPSSVTPAANARSRCAIASRSWTAS